jgi:formylglycine-generating enzyme required for sulfatase activity
MVGNVFEWVDGWSSAPRFTQLPNSEKENRGGSYNRPPDDLVTWYSESDPPGLAMSDVGFRCAYVEHEKSVAS